MVGRWAKQVIDQTTDVPGIFEIIGTSEAWWKSRLSHQPCDPAYYIEDCWISKPATAVYVGQIPNFSSKHHFKILNFCSQNLLMKLSFYCRNYQHRLAQTYVQNLVRLVMLANPPIFR